MKKTNKLDNLIWFLKEQKITYQLEHEFDPTRKWRFDLAIVHDSTGFKLAIEYEGIHSNKSRHTTQGGYAKDCEKYNAATILGWKVLRYTAGNVKNAIQDVKQILKIK